MAESRESSSNEQLIEKLECIKNLYVEERKKAISLRLLSKVQRAIDKQIKKIREHGVVKADQAKEIQKALTIISNRFADDTYHTYHPASLNTYNKIWRLFTEGT